MASPESQKFAEKLLKLLESSSGNQDIASIFASLEKINHRLDKLEASPLDFSLKHSFAHPSQEKFDVKEATLGTTNVPGSKEKACAFEPNNRPCDHCSMCSTRGF